jgi:hypothetical protein
VKKFLMLATTLALSTTLWAWDLTGRWTGTFQPTDGESGGALLVLKQTGNELTGTAGPNENEQSPIKNGKIDGDKITFDLERENGTMHFELTASGKRLSGTINREHDGEKQTAKLDVTKEE